MYVPIQLCGRMAIFFQVPDNAVLYASNNARKSPGIQDSTHICRLDGILQDSELWISVVVVVHVLAQPRQPHHHQWSHQMRFRGAFSFSVLSLLAFFPPLIVS